MAPWTLSRDDDHRSTRALLPWRVTGQLDPEDARRVDAHLAVCASCRAGLAEERLLREAFLSSPLPAMDARLARRRRIGVLAGAVGALGAIAASLALAVVSLQPASTPVRHATYRTLADPAPTSAGDVVVVFDPACSVEQMRSVLTRAHARIVDGPTATGAYVLRIPRGGRVAALAALRSSPQVRVAESLGSDQ